MSMFNYIKKKMPSQEVHRQMVHIIQSHTRTLHQIYLLVFL